MFDFLIRPFRRNFGIDKEYYRFVDDMFGFIPHNIELYKLALIHKSASQSIGGHHINNERLEFLGDAVIESVTSDYLYIEFPDRNEGFMTQLRAKIVSRQSLNEIAHRIGLDKYVVYNSSGNFTQKHIHGDAFEAMIGAIYLDQGYDFVNRLLINKIYYNHLSLDSLTESETDFKSRLIEWCQKNRHNVTFRTRSDAHAPRTAPTFYSTVLIDGIEVGHGVGDSKKVAEQNAACSLSHEISDEECAEMLDKLDKISPVPEVKQQEAKLPSKPAKTKKSPKAESTATTDKTESSQQAKKSEKSEKPKRTKKSPKEENAPKAEDIIENAPKAEKEKKSGVAEKAEKAKKSAKAAKTEQSDNDTEKSEKPKRRRRTSKPKKSAEVGADIAPSQESTADSAISA